MERIHVIKTKQKETFSHFCMFVKYSNQNIMKIKQFSTSVYVHGVHGYTFIKTLSSIHS